MIAGYVVVTQAVPVQLANSTRPALAQTVFGLFWASTKRVSGSGINARCWRAEIIPRSLAVADGDMGDWGASGHAATRTADGVGDDRLILRTDGQDWSRCMAGDGCVLDPGGDVPGPGRRRRDERISGEIGDRFGEGAAERLIEQDALVGGDRDGGGRAIGAEADGRRQRGTARSLDGDRVRVDRRGENGFGEDSFDRCGQYDVGCPYGRDRADAATWGGVRSMMMVAVFDATTVRLPC